MIHRLDPPKIIPSRLPDTALGLGQLVSRQSRHHDHLFKVILFLVKLRVCGFDTMFQVLIHVFGLKNHVLFTHPVYTMLEK